MSSEERTLRVQGKGWRVRLVPLGRRAFGAVLHYLHGGARDQFPGAGASELLFLSARLEKRLDPKTLQRYGRRGGADIRVVQELLGHRSLATTERYTHLVTEDLRREIQKHHPRERMED